MATIKNTQGVLVDSVTGMPVQTGGGLGNFGTYTSPDGEVTGVAEGAYNQMKSAGTPGLAENGWTSKVGDWFTPQGDKGTSVGGNMMNALGTGVGAVTGLAGMYYTKKNFDLQKDNQQYLRNREAQSDSRKSAFASNAGNGAQY